MYEKGIIGGGGVKKLQKRCINIFERPLIRHPLSQLIVSDYELSDY